MTDLSKFVSDTAGTLQAARRQGGVGVLAEFDNGAFVQYQVNPQMQGTDGRALMAVEIGSTGRLGRRQKAQLNETGWEAPKAGSMPNWWHLVGDEQEARIVVGQLVVLHTAARIDVSVSIAQDSWQGPQGVGRTSQILGTLLPDTRREANR